MCSGRLPTLTHRNRVEYFRILETGSGLIFPRDRKTSHRPYPKHPFAPEFAASLSKFPPGFRELTLQCAIGMDVVHIIDRVADYMTSKVDPSKATSQPHTGKTPAPDIFDTCTILGASSSQGHMIERNICLAIILFAYSVYSTTRDSTTVFRGARQALTRTLPSTHYSTHTERCCLIWIYMIAIEAWHGNVREATEMQALLKQMLDRFPESLSWPSVEAALEQFFWYEPLARRWRMCWEEGIQVRQSVEAGIQATPTLRRAELHGIWTGTTPIRIMASQHTSSG